MPDYMPRKDANFLVWAMNFSTYLSTHGAELGLTPQQIADVSSGVGTLEQTINEHTTAQFAAQSVRLKKDNARTGIEDTIRTLVRQLQASTAVGDAQRESMGITIAGKGAAATNSHLPTSPKGTVDTSHRLRHTIRYWDENNMSRRARPAHTIGCEIWVAITEPGEAVPLDTDKYRNMALSTASPFMIEYGGEDAAKTANYMLRWILNGGQKGPWGPIVSATIVG